jgi:uncharacterized protein with GYD domain
MGSPVTDRVRDSYFSLWTLTEIGRRDPEAVQQTIAAASAMIRDLGGECRLYVCVGGWYDLIGVARGDALDDTKIVQVQHAIQAFGTLHVAFVKAREFSLSDFQAYTGEVRRLQQLKP